MGWIRTSIKSTRIGNGRIARRHVFRFLETANMRSASPISRIVCDRRTVFVVASHIRHLRHADRNRAGLIEHKRVGGTQPVRHLTAFDEHAVARAVADTRHIRHGYADDERARTAEHKHGDRKVDATRRQANNNGDNEHRRRVIRGEAVDKAFLLGFGVLRVFDELDDPAERGVLTHHVGTDGQHAIIEQGAGGGARPRGFADRDRLAGDGGFVDEPSARHHGSIDGNAITSRNLDNVADMHIVDRNGFESAIGPSDRCRLRRHIGQSVDCRARLVQRVSLDLPADEEQECDNG